MSQVLNPSLINYRCQQVSFSIESCSQLAISTQSSHCKQNFIQMQEVTRSTWRMRNVGREGKGKKERSKPKKGADHKASENNREIAA